MKPIAKIIIVTSLSFLGLLDILFRYRLCGNDGLVYALNDPGKTLFHIVILPMASAIFLNMVPAIKMLFKSFNWKLKRASWIIGVFLSLIAGVIFYNETTVYCYNDNKTYLLPHDVPDSAQRANLVCLRKEISELIITKKDPGKIVKDKEEYLSILSIEKRNCTPLKNLTSYTIVSFIETTVGVVFAIVVFFLMVITVLAYQRDRPSSSNAKILIIIDQVFLIGFVLASYIIFRGYSDYYINFLNPTPVNLFNSIGVTIALIFFSLLYVLRKAGRTLKKLFMVTYGFLAAIFSFGRSVHILYISSVMTAFYGLPTAIKIFAYLMSLTPILLIILSPGLGKREAIDHEPRKGPPMDGNLDGNSK